MRKVPAGKRLVTLRGIFGRAAGRVNKNKTVWKFESLIAWIMEKVKLTVCLIVMNPIILGMVSVFFVVEVIRSLIFIVMFYAGWLTDDEYKKLEKYFFEDGGDNA